MRSRPRLLAAALHTTTRQCRVPVMDSTSVDGGDADAAPPQGPSSYSIVIYGTERLATKYLSTLVSVARRDGGRERGQSLPAKQPKTHLLVAHPMVKSQGLDRLGPIPRHGIDKTQQGIWKMG